MQFDNPDSSDNSDDSNAPDSNNGAGSGSGSGSGSGRTSGRELGGDNGPSNGSSLRIPGWLTAALASGAIAVAGIAYLSHKLGPPNQQLTAAVPDDPEESAKRTPVQDFTLTDADGGQKRLTDFKGQVVILSFWASWCTPCLVELPTFAELQEKFDGRGLTIVPVNVDEGDEGKVFARDFWNKRKFPFTNYFDTQKALAQQFEVEMLPSNFVIDRQGRMVFSSFGANDWTSAQTVEFLDSLLAEADQVQ